MGIKNNLSIQYDFRDNYLSKSRKGKDYIEYYYELSKFGIENNLVLDLSGQAGTLVFPFLGLFICLSLLICYYQVVWKHHYSLMPFKRGIPEK